MKLNLLIALLFVLLASKSINAQPFTGGFSFVIPYDDTTSNTFLPKFSNAPLTDADSVRAVGENFIVKGKNYRFWGAGLAFKGLFPSASDAQKIAGHASKMGINLFRMHHLDFNNGFGLINSPNTNNASITSQNIHTSKLDTFDKFLYYLKQNGIYVDINLNSGRYFKIGDGHSSYHNDSMPDYAKYITQFDPRLIQLQKEYAKKLFSHINPYTGKKLGEDPVLAMVELINENSMYGAWRDGKLKYLGIKQADGRNGRLSRYHDLMLDTLWSNFLKNKYANSKTNLANAWKTPTLAPGSSPEILINTDFSSSFAPTSEQTWYINPNSAPTSATLERVPDSGLNGIGDYAAKLTNVDTKTNEWGLQLRHWRIDTSKLDKDSLYEFSFYAKTNDETQKVSISITNMMAVYPYDGKPICETQSLYFTNNWKKYSFILKDTTDPITTKESYFYTVIAVGGNAGTRVLIDKASLKKYQRISLEAGEDWENYSIKRTEFYDRYIYSEQRYEDLSEFYITIQKNYLESMRSYLRDTCGIKVPISGHNAFRGIQDGYASQNMDFYDDHKYWDENDGKLPIKIKNTPMVKDDRLSSISEGFSGIPMQGKPLTISEFNHPAPNIYQVEMVPILATYGSFHNAAALMFHSYNAEQGLLTWSSDFINNPFFLDRNNAVMSLFPSAAFAYRNFLLDPLPVTTIDYSKKFVFGASKYDINKNGDSICFTPYDKKLQLTRSIRTKNWNASAYSSSSTLPVPAPNTALLNTSDGTFVSKYGYPNPKFVCATGYLHKPYYINASPLYINSNIHSDISKDPNLFGSLTVVPLNKNNTIYYSDSTLVTISCGQQNTGMIWTGNQTLTNWGSAPTIQRDNHIVIKFYLDTMYKILKVHRLNEKGQIIPGKTVIINGVLSPYNSTSFDKIEIGKANDNTLWYGLEALKNSSMAKLAPGTQDNEYKITVYPNPASSELNIDYYTESEAHVQCKILNTLGQVVITKSVMPNNLGSNTSSINTSSLISGVYYLKLEGTDINQTCSFIISK